MGRYGTREGNRDNGGARAQRLERVHARLLGHVPDLEAAVGAARAEQKTVRVEGDARVAVVGWGEGQVGGWGGRCNNGWKN